MSIADQQAFPGLIRELKEFGSWTDAVDVPKPGMTLLQHYAGLAMQGVLSNADASRLFIFGPDDFASHAVKCAKALIAELEKQP